MNSNIFGEHFKIITFGESHGPAVGVVIDGVQPNISFDIDKINKELQKRKPGTSKFVSQRKEDDKIEILSGVFEGKTLGTPICLIVWNKGQHSNDYEEIKDIFRPSQADFSYFAKYGIRDFRGGGRSSGRETVARVAAGAVAKQLLKESGINFCGFVRQIGTIRANELVMDFIEQNALKCPDPFVIGEMESLVNRIQDKGDSIGGIVELWIDNVPAGLGDPVFGKLDALLAGALMSIGAVKGVEFGLGFDLSVKSGSEVNDPITVKKENENFKVSMPTNRSGGILGGISTGEKIVIRVSVKPTPSISKQQESVNQKGEKVKLKIKGRHDPCICPRIVPVVESMAAIVILEAYLTQMAISKSKVDKKDINGEIVKNFDNLLYYIAKNEMIINNNRTDINIDDIHNTLENILNKNSYNLNRKSVDLIKKIIFNLK